MKMSVFHAALGTLFTASSFQSPLSAEQATVLKSLHGLTAGHSDLLASKRPTDGPDWIAWPPVIQPIPEDPLSE